ncbi:head maturation protease, ClpP-related [Virgibacillus sp. W0430]|uniref:head maturation protease, ClpP-related n=1 Tax=Virgibacillus sp. W0430 TaxID=3391580 RepID=UPI003F485B22
MTVKNLTDKSADLYIYGEIVDNTDWKWDEYDVMPDDVKGSLEKVDGLETLNIYINSPGGSVFAGLAIYNMLKRNEAKKIVHIDGVAASMASIIALVGDEVYMPSNAFMMIHKPLTWVIGNANDLRKIADDLDTIESGLMQAYEENLREGVDVEEVKQMVNDETWLTADEATKYFNIEITKAVEVTASASHLLENFKNVPKTLLKEDKLIIPKMNDKDKNQFIADWESAKKTDEELEKIKLQNEIDLLNL